MKIERIRAFPLEYPEPNNDGKLRSVALVAIDAAGATGWGEAISGSAVVSQAVALIVERRLAPLLEGRDPRNVVALWSELRDATFWEGTGGIVTFALSAIDMALWDLAGKLQGAPLHTLLGGARRERIRACASAIFASHDLERIGREFSSFAAAGYTAVKGGWGHDLSIGFGKDRARDTAIARTVRDAVGPRVDVICDVVAHAGWTASYAISMARSLLELNLYWLEDPLPEHDLEGYRRLRAAVPELRICTGEKGWTTRGYRALIDADAVDVVMSDPGRSEGVTGTREIIEMAGAAGMAWNAHSWSSALNTAAALHLGMVAPSVLLFELKPLPSPMQHELVTNPIEHHDGWVSAPEGPGLGVEVDERVVVRYRIPS